MSFVVRGHKLCFLDISKGQLGSVPVGGPHKGAGELPQGVEAIVGLLRASRHQRHVDQRVPALEALVGKAHHVRPVLQLVPLAVQAQLDSSQVFVRLSAVLIPGRNLKKVFGQVSTRLQCQGELLVILRVRSLFLRCCLPARMTSIRLEISALCRLRSRAALSQHIWLGVSRDNGTVVDPRAQLPNR